MKRQFLCICAIFLGFLLYHPTAVVSAEETTNTTSKPKVGWVLTDGIYQYYDSKGDKLIGWQQINNNWYYLGNDGNMQTGWIAYGGRNYYLKPSGEMATGWV